MKAGHKSNAGAAGTSAGAGPSADAGAANGAAASAGAPAASAPATSGGVGQPREIARAPLGSLSASKWAFTNGLTVVLIPDASATSIAYTTWFRVGSRDEDEAAGQTGLAHLFEHLMFTQTKGQPVGAFESAESKRWAETPTR